MKRNLTGKIALVVFFSLYALSPLTYDLSTKSISCDLSRRMSERSLRNASLYLIEVIYDSFSGANEPENESSPDRVLIKKNGAVLRGKFDLFPKYNHIAAFAAADPSARCSIHLGKEQIKIEQVRFKKNSACLPLSSGLSPPSLL